jgi:hypothetical protein
MSAPVKPPAVLDAIADKVLRYRPKCATSRRPSGRGLEHDFRSRNPGPSGLGGCQIIKGLEKLAVSLRDPKFVAQAAMRSEMDPGAFKH